MRRRALLRRLAGPAVLGTAGCLSEPADAPRPGSRSPTATTTATPRSVERTDDGSDDTGTPAAGVPRRLSLDAVADDGLGSNYDVAASATVAEPRVTADHTATVVVRLRNRGDRDRTLTYVARECNRNMLSASLPGGDGGLVLAPADAGLERADDRCWRLRHREASCGIPAVPKSVELPADETVTWRFDVWATPKGPCMPPGRYRFRRRFHEGDGTPDETAPAMVLALSVTVPDD